MQGRLISYTIVGAVFGAMGTVISYDIEFKSMLLTMCGLLRCSHSDLGHACS